MGKLLVVLGAAAWLACAGPPQVDRSVLAGTVAQDMVVLPFNVAALMPSELEVLSPIVWKELEIYLRAQGKRLRTLNFATARRLWLKSIRQVRSGEGGEDAGYPEAVRAFVLELSKHADFDTVIAPSLFVREAHIRGREASWDGVERPVEVEAIGLAARSAVASAPLEGSAPAASLHAVVLDAEGNLLQEGKGGLELLVRVRVLAPGATENAPKFEYVGRTDLFANRANVREGIGVALSPFLPPLRIETE